MIIGEPEYELGQGLLSVPTGDMVYEGYLLRLVQSIAGILQTRPTGPIKGLDYIWFCCTDILTSFDAYINHNSKMQSHTMIQNLYHDAICGKFASIQHEHRLRLCKMYHPDDLLKRRELDRLIDTIDLYATKKPTSKILSLMSYLIGECTTPTVGMRGFEKKALLTYTFCQHSPRQWIRQDMRSNYTNLYPIVRPMRIGSGTDLATLNKDVSSGLIEYINELDQNRFMTRAEINQLMFNHIVFVMSLLHLANINAMCILSASRTNGEPYMKISQQLTSFISQIICWKLLCES